MCYAQDGPLFAAASESVPLPNLGFQDVHSLEPGEMIVIQDNQIRRRALRRRAARRSHCFFEWIYFANVASTLDDRSVYLSRAALGKELARQEHQLGRVPLDDDTIVVPVPDTGKAAADAMAYELGVPSVEGLMRNRYVGRTFIEGQNRADRVRMKYTPLREVLEGKRVLLIEDTIVRSTTLQVAAAPHPRARRRPRDPRPRRLPADRRAVLLRHRHVHGAGAVRAALHAGRTRPTEEEQQAMAAELGADSLFYLPLEAVARCIGLPEDRLCRACLTGQYPTATGKKAVSTCSCATRHNDAKPHL